MAIEFGGKGLQGLTKLLSIAVLAVGILSASNSGAEEGDIGFSASQTDRTVAAFSKGIEGCMEAPPVFRVDCFQHAYSSTVRVIANASAYWEAEVALTRVNRTLYQFVRANTDKSLGKERYGSFKPRAINESVLAEAQALYADLVDKAVAIMRGGSSSELKYFQPLADAVEATRDALR
ncbi:hypothetical protein [Shimia sp. SK013]|uniref:hypothetical protein n=1 Tax=Shimia sp. SK013 TaxID=1389006 RepID=UPI00128F6989|nr:hypothetical protein [Shimia sp. SK013]